jgi:VWFA-related protein
MIWLLGIFLPLAAQQPAPQPAADTPVFRSDTNLALVRFHVVRKHSYASDLKRDDVILLEDGQPRPIASFEGGSSGPRSAPVEMILLFDTSGSVKQAGLLDPLAYQTALLDRLPAVRLSVYAFNAALWKHCRSTRDPSEIEAALRRVLDGPRAETEAARIALELPRGRKGAAGTWLFEAIMAAAKDASGPLVVFSDGLPTTTTRSEDAAAALAALGIPVYPVVLGHAGTAGKPWGPMQEMFMADFARLAEGTGGRSFDPPAINLTVVREILAALAEEIRCEYVVGFAPPASSGGVRRHKLEVKLRSRELGSVQGGTRTVIH